MPAEIIVESWRVRMQMSLVLTLARGGRPKRVRLAAMPVSSFSWTTVRFFFLIWSIAELRSAALRLPSIFLPSVDRAS
jgi:hypothetical protein